MLKRMIKKLLGYDGPAEKKIPIPQPVDTTQLLRGKTALITGGSSGIGLAVAEAFLRNGASVVIAGSTQEKLELAEEKLGRPERLRSLQIDVRDAGALPAKIADAAAFFGPIDILVNSAGTNDHTKFLEITEEAYDRVMATNLKGTFFMCQAMAKHMIATGRKGHILIITSASALRPAWSPYRMSKWALKGFTLGLAEQLLPHGIVVNAIAPGPVATPMLHKIEGDSIEKEDQPSGRYAMPSEIANMAVMLSSEMGDLVVGDTLYMTGGSGNLSLHR